MNAGQVCLAGTRVLVERSIAGELLGKVRAACAQMIVGDPRDAKTRVGPLITREHFARVAGLRRAREGRRRRACCGAARATRRASSTSSRRCSTA